MNKKINFNAIISKLKSHKILSILLVVVIVIAMAGILESCKDDRTNSDYENLNEEEEMKFKEFKWPDSDIAKLLPVPESNIGHIEWEASYGFVIYVSETTREDYNAYVDKCLENGFTVEYYRSENSYYGDNESGYHVSVRYEEDFEDVMFIRIDDPDDSSDGTTTSEQQTTDQTTEQTPENNATSTAPASGVRPEIKEAIDSYEAFFNEYVDFMNKYNNTDDVSSLMSDYTSYMSRYTDVMSKLDALETELNADELAYYSAAMARINEKIATIQ